MTLRVALHHDTHYRYDRPVQLGAQTIRLRPAPHCRTPVQAYSLRVTPAEHFLNWQQDPQGNFLARVAVPEPTREFRVVVDLVAEMSIVNPFDFFLEESAEHWPFRYEPWLEDELEPFLRAEKEGTGPRLEAWLAEVPREEAPLVPFLVDLNQRLEREIEYVIRMEPGVQTPEETLGLGRGSCRDSAWLLVHVLRRLGIAARFASGYLIQLVPDQKSLDGPSGPSADFTDLHAWTEAYLPGAGWVGLDPTSGLLAGEGHLPLACSPKPLTAAPITGKVGRCEVEFEHRMTIERVLESPRVTKPYTEAEWQTIDALGEAVDSRLQAQDVRLTMGGEPTFVSIDDMEGAEWNTDAVGPTKRVLAADLARRLQQRFAPGGLLHYGQGKWYPGEPLPRWAFAIHWRDDGLPLWRDPARIADEARDYAPSSEQARRFALGIAERLAVEPSCVAPAYEDASHPAAKPADERQSDDAVAWILPVQVWNARDGRVRWRSESWQLPSGRLQLLPGDSPAGFRLPLESLPAVDEDDWPHVFEADPTLPRPPLQAPDSRRQPFLAGPGVLDAGLAGSAPPGVVRTALVVEPRDGRLCVFLPPVEDADAYVDLVAVVEDTAAAEGAAIHVEGYEPPPDPRLRVIKVTPDPGVIEANVHPASSWKELREITEILYHEARESRLSTEKFMIDGRHTGTGGGNHFVLGAAKPLDSPFLRRPELLRSLVAYWINHPSLSYLFSGLFIGPTSQAPRVDEARQDALYELEIAFRQIPEPGEECPPWLVDRLLRDLLVDVTGNTHRAEFCIDKLYSPDSATGRLGLVELRAFEMPPHARMSLVQQLLLRALVSRFWEEPYRAPLTRFGTGLHDRFLLPHFVWSDFREVVAELRRAGFAFEESWFAPHFEFRFPRYGAIQQGDIEIELRQALEPWHVLGEDGAPGGTARYVDSSLERVQVRVRGLHDQRFQIGCNGVRVPLSPTGRPGEAVAGVRFRAWQPARCLHPTIPVHAPLTFDLVDTGNGRSVAGCRYHVAHPGGRSYDTFPVNANEAEGRRLARFFPFGHTPGPLVLAEPPSSGGDFPVTLDLRTYSL